MLNRIGNCLRDWIKHTEPPSDHQQSGNPVDGLLNGNDNGSDSDKRENREILQDEKKEINEGTNLTQNEKGDENEGKFQNEKESEVVGEAEQERNRGARFPVRSDAENCSSGLQIGLCEFGMNSKSGPPPYKQLEVNGKKESLDSAAQDVKEKDDSKAERVDCKNFDHPGGCNSEKSSKFSRRRRSSCTAELNFMGLPIRLGKKDCPYYMHHGSCKFGATCCFNHPNPTCVGGSDSQLGLSSEGSVVSPNASQSTLGSTSPAALGDSPPFVPLMFSSTLGSSSPAALTQSPPYVPLMFPLTHGAPCQPEWHPYQAAVYLSERGMQPASAYTAVSQSLEGIGHTPQQHQIIIDEFPERPAQPECSYFLTGNCICGSACRFHHPRNGSANSTSSGLNDSGLPLRSDVQPLIPEAVVPPTHDVSFAKKHVGQNSVSNGHKSKPKQRKAIPKKKSSNPNVRCDFCEVDYPSIQLYEEHLSGKKHTTNLHKFHASRASSAAKASQPINKSCNASQMGTPSGEGTAAITNTVTNLESKKKRIHNAGEVGIPSGKGTSGFMTVVSDLEVNNQKSCSASVMGTPSGKDKGGFTSVETNFDTKKRETCSAGEVDTPGGKGTAGFTSVVTDVEATKQKLSEGGISLQSLRICTICNVVCNDEGACAGHMAGKKHAQKSRRASEMGISRGKDTEGVTALGTEKQKGCSASERGTPSGKDMARFTGAVSDWETKKEEFLEGDAAVQSQGVCTMSNVFCDGDKAFAEHMVQKKHLTEEQALVTLANADPASITNPTPKSNEEIHKKVNNDLSALCEACKISCRDGGGKQETSCAGEIDTPGEEGTAGVTSVVTNLEATKQKLLKDGIAFQSLRMCTLCNVVCNGEGAFAEHMAGKKHAQKSRRASEIGISSRKDTEGVTAVVTDLGAEEQKSYCASEMATPNRVTNAVSDLETKKEELLEGNAAVQSLGVCTMSNVFCNGGIEFAELPEHMVEKKRLTQEKALFTFANTDHAPITNPNPKFIEEMHKKVNDARSTWCEVCCKIRDASLADLSCHEQGKKHEDNGEKLQNLRTYPTSPASTASSEDPEDVETKKHKECALAPLADPNSSSATYPKSNPNEEGTKKTNGDQSAWCEVCKVRCTSLAALSHHEQGKKHKNNVEKLQNVRTDSTGPAPTASSKDPEGMETKKQKEQAPGTKADPNSTSATNRKSKPNEEATKKTINACPARCEVCKVSCTSLEDLNHHKRGKKHKANVGKSQKHPKTDPIPPAPTAAPTPSAQSKEPKDLETKKQRVLQHGAPAVGVRICTVCNVVCNSEKVYNDHLASKKHAVIVKEKEAAKVGNDS